MRGTGAGLLVPHILVLTLLVGSADVGRLRAQQDTALTEAVVELRIMGGPQEVLLALVRDSILFLPLHRFLELAEIGILESSPGTRVTGVVQPEGVEFLFDTEQQNARSGDTLFPLGPERAAWRDKVLYVASQEVATAFDVTINMDWVELVVVVWHAEGLPVLRRLEQERRREALLKAGARASPSQTVPLESRIADGAVLDWAVTTATRDPLNTSALDLGLGAQLAGGALDVRHTERRTTLGRIASTRASWIKAWGEQPWLRQARLGDVAATGRRVRGIRGAAFTNAPFLRPSFFGSEVFAGQFRQDWEVELYQGDRLIRYAPVDPAGRYSFTMPVRYGPNPMSLIAYGPHGEIVPIRRTFEIPFTRLPNGQFEYAVSGGECDTDPCQATANVDLRYGISTRFTVQAGADRFWRDTLPDLWHPYAVVSASVFRSLSITTEAVLRGLVGVRTDFTPTPDFRVSLQHRRYAGDVTSPIVGSAVLRNQTVGSLFWRPGRRDRGLYFQVNVLRTKATSGTRDLIRVAATSRLAGTRTRLAVRREGWSSTGVPRHSRVGFEAQASKSLSGPGALVGTFIQGDFAVDHDSGLASVNLDLGRQISSAARIDLETGWQRGARGFGLGLALTLAMPTVRAVSRSSYSRLAGVQGTHSAEGSVVWDRWTKRVVLGDGRGLGRAGLAGEVFLDSNGNGVRDVTEAAIEGLSVGVGAHRITTDSLGRFAVWDVIPFEAVIVRIDSADIDNPLWIPASPALSVYPQPNAFSWVGLPLVMGGEANGRVAFAATGRGAGGIRLLFSNLDTGEVVRTTTFSDGSFYVFGLRPGDYELTVTPEQAKRLGVSAAPVRLRVEISEAGIVLDNIVVTLEPF